MKKHVRKTKGVTPGAEYKDQHVEESQEEMKEKIDHLASNLDNKLHNSKRKPLSKEEFDKRLKELLSAGDKKAASKFVEDFEATEYSNTGALLLKFTEIPQTPKQFYFNLKSGKKNVISNVTPHQVTMFYLNKSPVL
jgi:hypothetical protein